MFCNLAPTGRRMLDHARPCRGSNSPIWLSKITLFRESCNWTTISGLNPIKPPFSYGFPMGLLPSFLATTISCLAKSRMLSYCIDSIETPINTSYSDLQYSKYIPSHHHLGTLFCKLPLKTMALWHYHQPFFLEKSTRNRLGQFQWDPQSSWATPLRRVGAVWVDLWVLGKTKAQPTPMEKPENPRVFPGRIRRKT